MVSRALTIPARTTPSIFQDIPVDNKLAANVTTGFGIVTYRGKVWRTKYKGEETTLMREDGSGPLPVLDVIILDASAALSKIYYEKGYEDGSNTPPDCFSTDGIRPDRASPKPQSPMCKSCKWNAFGSATKGGQPGKGKACADNRRLAIVPLADPANEMFGGPMLLRVPPDSLQECKVYGDLLAQAGYHTFAVATRISFDLEKSHPRLMFDFGRVLTNDEELIVKEVKELPLINQILSEPVDEVVHHETEPATSSVQQAAVKDATTVVQPQPAASPKPVQQPVQSTTAPAAKKATGFGGGAKTTTSKPTVAPVQTKTNGHEEPSAGDGTTPDDFENLLDELIAPGH
jgi:hypothetical protein